MLTSHGVFYFYQGNYLSNPVLMSALEPVEVLMFFLSTPFIYDSILPGTVPSYCLRIEVLVS